MALKPFVFPAPAPEPSPEPSDVCAKERRDDFNDLSLPAYPCEDCRETFSDFYCDPCKAQWEKEQEAKREREQQKQAKRNARQRAYVKRDGKPSNTKPLDREHAERTIAAAFTSEPDNAFTTDELCERVFPGLRRPERKHRAAVVPIAKTVCERLGEQWDWWRGEVRGRTLVFWNRASVTSYAMARYKSDWLYCNDSEEELKARIAPGGTDHDYVVEGGAWWQHCEEDLAKFKQQR